MNAGPPLDDTSRTALLRKPFGTEELQAAIETAASSMPSKG
jgi:hypothetical protein